MERYTYFTINDVMFIDLCQFVLHSLCFVLASSLKMTDVELNLLTDIDQHLLIKEGIRGDVAMISHWYARTSAPGMENYDASKGSSYIMYLDANNSYGWAITQPVPTFNFKWLTDEEMEELDLMMVSDDSSREYILEYDLG